VAGMRGFALICGLGVMLGAWAGPTPKASPSELVLLGGNEVVGVVGTKVITRWDILRDVKDELSQRQGTIHGVLQEQLRAANARMVLLSQDHAEAKKVLEVTESKLKAAKDKGDMTESAKLEKEVSAHKTKLTDLQQNLDAVAKQLREMGGKSLKQMNLMQSSLMKVALAQRIDDQLLVQDLKNKQAKAMKLPAYQPPPGLMEKLVRGYMEDNKMNREQLTLYLRREGIPYAQFQEEQLDKELLRYINNRSRVVVSPRKIRDFYLRHKGTRYSLGRAVTLHYLALPPDKYPDLKTASEARKAVKGMGDIQKLATDLGEELKQSTVSEDDEVLAKPIVDASKSMAKDEVELARVAGVNGKATYFVLFAEKVEDDKVVPLDEVRPLIEKELIGRMHAAKRKRELDRIRLTIPNFNYMK